MTGRGIEFIGKFGNGMNGRGMKSKTWRRAGKPDFSFALRGLGNLPGPTLKTLQ
jgi:hypothetical protein